MTFDASALVGAGFSLRYTARDLKVAPTDPLGLVAAAFRLRSFSRHGTAPRSKTRKLKLAATDTPAAERSFGSSHIQIPYILRILLDERAPGLHLVPHQDGKCAVRIGRIFDRNLEHRSRVRVHGGASELFRVHLPEAFEPGDRNAASLEDRPLLVDGFHRSLLLPRRLRFVAVFLLVRLDPLQDFLPLILVERVEFLLPLLDLVERGLGDVDVSELDDLFHIPEEKRQERSEEHTSELQ